MLVTSEFPRFLEESWIERGQQIARTRRAAAPHISPRTVLARTQIARMITHDC